MGEDLHQLSLIEVGRAIASRRLSARETTEAMLARVDQLQPVLGAYVHVMRDQALAAARQADSEIGRGLVRGPLHGVPVALKDLVDTFDAPTGSGTTIMAAYQPAADATVARRLREAGAVILGKLKMTEGALSAHHPTASAPLNPWNPGRTAGYSSSGSGVAVAADLCFAALGSDTGGSIRIPSAANGITGLKPTWGRVSRAGIYPLVESLDTVGPMARSAADAAAVLTVIAGHDPADPTSSLTSTPDYLAALDQAPLACRIGVDWRWLEGACKPGALDLLRATARRLQELGATLIDVTMPMMEVEAVYPLIVAGVAHAHKDTYPARAADYGPQLAGMVEGGRATGPLDLYGALMAAERFKGRMAQMFSAVDMLLLPVFTGVVPDVGEQERKMLENPAEGMSLLPLTLAFNIAGLPTVTFPAGAHPDGMPFAAQLAGAAWSEAQLLKTAHRFQSTSDWHLRRPPI